VSVKKKKSFVIASRLQWNQRLTRTRNSPIQKGRPRSCFTSNIKITIKGQRSNSICALAL